VLKAHALQNDAAMERSAKLIADSYFRATKCCPEVFSG
jgi:hypothetical protein